MKNGFTGVSWGLVLLHEQQRDRLKGLLRFVEEIARLTENFVTSVGSYRWLNYHEHELRARICIRHDMNDEPGPVWLKIERLARIERPTPDADIVDWIKMSADPTTEPEVAQHLIQSMGRVEALELVKDGVADEDDVVA